MTTSARDLSASNLFHVLNRGADRQDIFHRPADWTDFLDRIGAGARDHGVRVHAFALMTNHFHLLVDRDGGDLAGFMWEIQWRHARRLNELSVDRTGPLFQRRYTSVPIVDDVQYVTAVRYIHRNPLPIVGARDLVDYRFSSLAAVIGRRAGPDWLAVDQVRARLDVGRHLDHVMTPISSDRLPFAWLPPQRPIEVAEVEEAVAHAVATCGWPAAPRLARAVVIHVALATRAATDADLAARGAIAPSTVRNHSRRLRAAMSSDPAVADLVRRSFDALR